MTDLTSEDRLNVNLFRLCLDYVVCCSKRPSLIGGMKPLVALPLYCVMRPKNQQVPQSQRKCGLNSLDSERSTFAGLVAV